MSEVRTERDSMGIVEVPADAYYGAQTQRAVDNFFLGPRQSGLVAYLKHRSCVAGRKCST
mgnify:CR=1 FL=1